MQIFTRLFFVFTFIFTLSLAFGQGQRYIDEVFTDVEVAYGDEYGLNPNAPTPFASNYTILRFLATQGQSNVIRQPLLANMYYPKGDTETNRPLIVYVHTGNFFPFPQNGSCGGTMRDSSNVEMATRLAKMGYVVAVVNYRQGWNPLDPQELIRRFFLINAAYRGVQDINTYVRYFKRTAAEFGNPHGIDPDKIVLWGQGTGGYLSLAASYLKSYPEIFATENPTKFVLLPPLTPQPIPMVLEDYNGNVTAEGPITTVDALYNSITRLPIGDTLCVPNHVGYSSDAALCVNLGGALGDSTWMSEGDVPLISFHVDTDFFAPVDTDVLNVPTATGPQPVVEVTGSRDLARRAERLGVNDLFKELEPSKDPYGQYNTSGFPSYYEFRSTPDDTSSPWEWSAMDNPPSTCNKDANIAKMYIDTILGYFAPRAVLALGLSSNTKDLTAAQVNLKLSPNPASIAINVSVAEESPIRSYAIYDISGRMVRNVANVNDSEIQLRRESLNDGLYIVRFQFDEGVVSRKVIFE